jgi:hypothetical protein
VTVAEVIDPLSGKVTVIRTRTEGVCRARAAHVVAGGGVRKAVGKQAFRSGKLPASECGTTEALTCSRS